MTTSRRPSAYTYDVLDRLKLRLSASRTMSARQTRAPVCRGLTFSDISAQTASAGKSGPEAYTSTISTSARILYRPASAISASAAFPKDI